jgi:hypothetical protein
MPSSSLFWGVGTILSALSAPALAIQYTLGDTYAGATFLNGFDFYTGADPMNGFVTSVLFFITWAKSSFTDFN